jgi:hypothetical protein
MRKAYRITGSSFTEPSNLPEGFTVKERLVGEVLGTKALVFHEVKDGSVVVYRQGVAGSNVKLSPEEVREVMNFLYLVDQEARRRAVLESTKCPGTPHRGHSASDWSCPYDRA